ncbi:MAG: hypothetical protein ACE366_25590 [Bradymonadia bacterium]
MLWATWLVGWTPQDLPEGISVSDEGGGEIYTMASRTVAKLTGAVKGALVNWRSAHEALARTPDRGRCAELARRAGDLDERLARLSAAYQQLAQLAEEDGPRSVAESHRRAVDMVAAQVRSHSASWARQCARLQPTASVPEPWPAPPRALCSDLHVSGEIMNLSGARWLRKARSPGGGADIARHLARQLGRERPTQWMYVIVLVDGAVLGDMGHRASAFVKRPLRGVGPARDFDVPGWVMRSWPMLDGVVVLPGVDGLQRGPALKGLLRPFANRLEIKGCSPQLVDHWGYADVGGQLGGGAPGSIAEVGPGVYRISSATDGPLGLAGNGGNLVPYADLELYLMGLIPAKQVAPVSFLANPRPQADGTVKADGRCRVDGRTLVKRFGVRPKAPGVWPVGIVVVSETPLDAGRLSRYRRAVDAFTRPGPDDAPRLYNFFEATGGRARLLPIVPTDAGGC